MGRASVRDRLSESLRGAAAGALMTLVACGTATTEFPQQTRLPAPQNLSTQTAGLSVTLSWDPVSGASAYSVYWAQGSTVATESGTRANTPGPPYVHQASTFGATYAFLVVAVDAGGVSGRASSVLTATSSNLAQEAPRDVRATAGDRQVILDWEPATGATGYQVEVTSQFGTFAVPDSVSSPFIHDSLLNRTEYHYRVRGKFGIALGPWSSPVSAVPLPATPGSPVFTDVRALIKTDADPIGTPHGAILLSWSKAEHAMEYQVYVKRAPDDTEQPLNDPDAFPLRDRSYLHAPVDFAVSYTYRVEAINDGVTSPLMNPLIGEVRASVPSPLEPGALYSYVVRRFDGTGESSDVQVVSVEPPDDPRARDLSWTPPSGGADDSQRLYRATTATSLYDLIATFADLATSVYRDEPDPPALVPTGLTIAQQAPDLLVTWSPISEAPSGYRLYWWEQTPGGGGSPESVQVLTTAYRHSDLQSGSTYRYAVQVEGTEAVSPNVSAVAP